MARVRLIDDDEAQLEIRKLILQQAGHEVVEVDADSIVLDLHMPTLEAGLRIIRGLAGARICVFTGYPQDLQGRPEELLVDKVLAKPARMEVLLEWLAEPR